MNGSKLKIVKDYEKLDPKIKALIKNAYPNGFTGQLIRFVNKKGMVVSAFEFETEEKIYLVRISKDQVKSFVEIDSDQLKANPNAELESKYDMAEEFPVDEE